MGQERRFKPPLVTSGLPPNFRHIRALHIPSRWATWCNADAMMRGRGATDSGTLQPKPRSSCDALNYTMIHDDGQLRHRL